MEVAIIVCLSILLGFGIICIPFMYSYYIYTKNRVFTKATISIFGVILAVIVAIVTLCAGICLIVFKRPESTLLISIIFSFITFVLALAYLILFIVIAKVNSKNKISYDQIKEIDWNDKIKNLEQKYGSFENVKEKYQTKHKKNYHSILTYYQSMLIKAKDTKTLMPDKMADVITFNDAFSDKWSQANNALVSFLTFKYCQILKNL